jgi:heavy metal translocating P-type ATPase
MMYYYTSNQIEAAFHLTHEIYFESAAMILTLITLGKFLEARAKRKTSSAVNALLDLTPQTATVEIGGIESVIPIEEISKDDIVIIRAGETIPADGIIKEGSGSIDESMLTGESLPVDKAVENRVTGGTLLKSGFIKVTVTAVGNESALARIIALVDDAASSKAPVQHLADKISGVFVPVIIGLAIVTLGVWLIIGEGFSFALARAVSVLVISCPCALGLATPAAISAGTGAGAKMGILSKSAEALETMYKTDTVVFDKTGTITEGKPRVAAVFNGVGREIAGDEASYILTPAVSIELQSGHPLAKAVIDKCDEDGILPEKVRNYRYIDGRGVAGEIGDDMYMGGNRILMREAGIDVSDCHDRENSIAENGQIPIYFSKNKNLLGILAMSDTIRPSAIETVKTLQKSNIDVVMLTGDNERTAKAIAKSAGIENVVSGVLPDGKDGEIMKLREAGKTVMMVGDGINDAPALTRADIGVAVGNGTDVAIEAADIIIMRNDLTDIPKALNLSRKVMRIIKQNLFWAFIYNIIGIPIAAGILYPIGILLNPMFAAAAMSVSSVTVVVNALRLQTQKSEVRSQKSERRSNAANTLNKD